MNTERLIVDRQSPELREALWRMVRVAKQDGGVLAPVTVVGPSQYANLSLRQELGRSGFANVRFILLPMLAELLGGASMAQAGRRPLTPVLEAVAVRGALQSAQEPLAQVKEHRSTQGSVRQSFRQLRQVSGAVLRELEKPVLNPADGSGSARREIVRLYRQFRHRTDDGWYDYEDLVEAAAEAVAAAAAPALRDLGLIIFYLPRNLTPGQINLILALAVKARCAALLGTTGDNDADGPVDQLAAMLQPVLGEAQSAGGGGSTMPLLPGEASLHVAPDAHEELRRVIRRIMANAESGMPLHRMAVLYRMDQPYGSLARDELELAGIRVAGPGRKPLGDTAAGRTLTGLLRLSSTIGTDDALRRDDVMAWLTDCPIRRPRYMEREAFSPARWDAISRKAGVVRGLAQWRKELTAYAVQMERDAESADDEVSEARVAGMLSDAGTARGALLFVENLAKDVQPPRTSTSSGGSKWGEFCRWADGLLGKYLRRNLSEDESAAKERIDRILQELPAADGLDSDATLTAFRQVIEGSLQSPMGHTGVTGEGVFVAPFSAATGMSFDAVWIVGMIEGSVPPPIGMDPLLPEKEWEEAGGAPVQDKRKAQERYDYLSAMATAPRRSLSFPVSDPSLRRRAFPAPWLLEQASALESDKVTSDTLINLKRPWLTVTASMEGSLSSLDVAADRYDYDLQRLLQWKQDHPSNGSGRSDTIPHPLVKDGPLARAAQMGRSRAGGSLTEFDGNLSSVAENARFALNLGSYPLSPTSLETWAACPFRYFLGRVLNLSALDDPEEETVISRLNRGSLVHEILEKFVEEAAASGNLPVGGQSWGEESARRLRRIADDVFREYERRDLTGKTVLWLVEREKILADLDTFLEKDPELRAQYGSAHTLVETRFGQGEGWQEAIDQDSQIRFRGAIDRIDLNANGAPTLIMDYKTGKSDDSIKALNADPIDKGRRLQLGAYSLAAKRRFPQAERVPAIYWFITERGDFKSAPSEPFDINDPETLKRFREGVSAITEGIRSGTFPANPGPQGWSSNCAYCDFDTLCQSRRFRLWEQKKRDPLVSNYLSLTGEGQPHSDAEDNSFPFERES